MHVYEATPEIQARLARHEAILTRLGRIEIIQTFSEKPPMMKAAALFIVDQTPIALPLSGSIDIPAEIKRLNQELVKLTQEMNSCNARLSNADFMARAKSEIIEEMQDRLQAFSTRKTKIEEALSRLQS